MIALFRATERAPGSPSPPGGDPGPLERVAAGSPDGPVLAGTVGRITVCGSILGMTTVSASTGHVPYSSWDAMGQTL
jgi:hypothetical protein